MSDREPGKKVNRPAEIYSREDVLPLCMHVRGLPEGSAEAERSGGSPSSFEHMHNTVPVAVKVVRIPLPGEANNALRVSPVLMSTASC